MTIHPALFSSRSEEWATPQDFFDRLDAEFQFTLDPCATAENAKCPTFFTRSDNGLRQDWGAHVVFCNPPYCRKVGLWAAKCHRAAQAGATVVMLVNSRTDARWFHDHVYGKAELRFVRGRLRFGSGVTPAPFPSLVAIYRPPDPMACLRPPVDAIAAGPRHDALQHVHPP